MPGWHLRRTRRIIQNLNEDYGITHSVRITQRKAEIARLKKLL